jgi:hypothetical protein
MHYSSSSAVPGLFEQNIMAPEESHLGEPLASQTKAGLSTQ